MPKGKPLSCVADPDMLRFMRQVFGTPAHAYRALSLGETVVQGHSVTVQSFHRIWTGKPARWADLKVWRRNLTVWATAFMDCSKGVREAFGRDYRLLPGVHLNPAWEPFSGEEDPDTGEVIRDAPPRGRPQPAVDVRAMAEL